MPENKLYPPEGLSAPGPLTLSALRDAQSSGAVLEAAALRCDAALCLHFQFGSVTARMPREEVTAPWITGAGRDIAVLSRVGDWIGVLYAQRAVFGSGLRSGAGKCPAPQNAVPNGR